MSDEQQDNINSHSESDCSAYSVDDRGNVVDCYGQDGGQWERVGKLDREAGPPPCNQTAWDNFFEDPGLGAYMRQEGYGAELDEAEATLEAKQ